MKRFTLIILLSTLASVTLEAATIQSLSERINKYGKLAQLHLQRAQLYIDQHAYAKAAEDLNRAIVIDPSLEEAQLFLVEILLEERDYMQAHTLLIKLLESPSSKRVQAQGYTLLGDLYHLQDQDEAALDAYKKAQKVEHVKREEDYIKLAEVYYALGDFRSSIKVLKRGLITMQKSDRIKEKMVDLSMLEGNYTLSLAMINDLLMDHPNSARLYYKQAKVFKEKGRKEQMEISIKKSRLSLLKHQTDGDEEHRIKKALAALYAQI